MLSVPFLDDLLWKWFKPQNFDDNSDRLNYFVTSTILAFFAILVSAKQYVGSPIQCWMPMEFKGGWEQYAEDYCFIQNTFFVPFHQDIPTDTDERTQAEIGYYQWVPIVLALQAIMFFVPNWIWQTLHRQSGVDLSSTIDDAVRLKTQTTTDRLESTTVLTDYIKEVTEFSQAKRSPFKLFCFRIGYSRGTFLCNLYLFIKFLYLINIIGQFYLMNSFLGSDYTFWGIQTFQDLMTGREWMESGVFPRVTLCDFKVRRLANIHRYTVQCVLMINMFNEKIYLFLWFWFFFVAVTTIINFVHTCFNLCPPANRVKTIKRMVKQAVPYFGRAEERVVALFAERALKPDGVLLMQFIESHAGAVVSRDITGKLWTDFLDEQHNKCSNPAMSDKTNSSIESHHDKWNAPEKLDKMSLMAPDYAKPPAV